MRHERNLLNALRCEIELQNTLSADFAEPKRNRINPRMKLRGILCFERSKVTFRACQEPVRQTGFFFLTSDLITTGNFWMSHPRSTI